MKSFRKSYLILEDSNYLKVIIWLSLPTLINSLLKSIIEILEIKFLSNLKITNDELNFLISSITITSPFLTLFYALISALTVVGTIMITNVVGKKNKTNIEMTEMVVFKIVLIIGVILNIISYSLSFFIFNNLTNLLVMKNSINYFRIKSFEMIPLALYGSFTASRTSKGDTFSPLLLTLCSFMVNLLLLNPLIGRYKIEGLAIASLISNIVRGLLCLIFLKKTKNNINFDKKIVVEMIKLSLPMLMSQIFLHLGFTIINNIIFKFNNQFAGAIHVCNRINTFLMLPINSLCSTLVVIISYNACSNNVKRIGIFIKYVVKIILILSLCDIIVVTPIRNWLLTLLLNNDSEMINLSRIYLIYTLIAIPVVGLCQLMISIFQGYGYIKTSMWLSISRLWLVRIPFLLALRQLVRLCLYNIGLIMVFSNLTTVIVATTIYYLKKHYIKKYQYI